MSKKRFKTGIQRAREHAGFSLAQAALYVGITTAEMRAVERVEQPPTINQLEMLSDLYCMQLIELLEGPDGDSPKFRFSGSTLTRQALVGIAQFHRMMKNYIKMRRILGEEVAAKIENRGRLPAEVLNDTVQ